jgi:hypothetical protein
VEPTQCLLIVETDKDRKQNYVLFNLFNVYNCS